MHSHSPFASEMFIIKGDVQQMLPSALVLRCKYRRQCVSEGIWGNGTERNIEDLSLSRVQSERVLRTVLSRSGNTSAVLCQYKSRNENVDGVAYTRSHYRARWCAKTCDNIMLEQGAKISMLVLNYPLSPKRTDILRNFSFMQHHRWYAGMEVLDY